MDRPPMPKARMENTAVVGTDYLSRPPMPNKPATPQPQKRVVSDDECIERVAPKQPTGATRLPDFAPVAKAFAWLGSSPMPKFKPRTTPIILRIAYLVSAVAFMIMSAWFTGYIAGRELNLKQAEFWVGLAIQLVFGVIQFAVWHMPERWLKYLLLLPALAFSSYLNVVGFQIQTGVQGIYPFSLSASFIASMLILIPAIAADVLPEKLFSLAWR